MELNIRNYNYNKFFYFDHNVFLLASSVDSGRFIKKAEKDECTPQSVYVFESADGNIIGLENVKEKRSKNTLLIVVPDRGSVKHNIELIGQVKDIHRLQINMKIGIFLSHNLSNDDVKKWFETMWNKHIINIFIAINPYRENITRHISDHLMNIFTIHSENFM